MTGGMCRGFATAPDYESTTVAMLASVEEETLQLLMIDALRVSGGTVCAQVCLRIVGPYWLDLGCEAVANCGR